MRKKQNINLAGKKDLDRQVIELKDFESLIKNQVWHAEMLSTEFLCSVLYNWEMMAYYLIELRYYTTSLLINFDGIDEHMNPVWLLQCIVSKSTVVFRLWTNPTSAGNV